MFLACCSNPFADALCPHTVDYTEYSASLPPQTYPDANTFYLYFFQQEAPDNYGVPKPIRGFCKHTGADLGAVARPGLWQPYDLAFSSCFEDIPTPPYSFRDAEQFSEDEDDIEAN